MSTGENAQTRAPTLVNVPITEPLIREALHLPEGSHIVGAFWSGLDNCVVLEVTNDSIPPEYDGKTVDVIPVRHPATGSAAPVSTWT